MKTRLNSCRYANRTRRFVAFTGSACVAAALAASGAPASSCDPAVLDSIGSITGVATDPLFNELSQACERNDLEMALNLVQRLQAKTAFRYAAEAQDQKRLKEAADGFKLVLSLDPSNDRARLELGRTLSQLGETEKAKEAFNNVLGNNPPDAVQRNIRKMVEDIETKPKRGGWGGQVTVGALADDNVNIGPSSRSIKVAPIRFGNTVLKSLTVNDNSTPKDDTGLFVNGELSGQYDLGQESAWGASGGGNYYESRLNNYTDFNVRYFKLHGAMKYSTAGSLLELPVAYEHIDRGSEALVDIVGFNPSRVTVSGGKWYWTTAGALEHRDYADFDDLDANYGELRETVQRTVGAARHSVSLSLAGFLTDADSNLYDNTGVELLLAGEAKLGWNSVLYGRLLERTTWYEERDLLAPEDRRDDELQASAGVNKRLNKNWSLDLSYQHTRSFSTYDLYDYERNIATFSSTASF